MTFPTSWKNGQLTPLLTETGTVYFGSYVAKECDGCQHR
jgi:hypothetical protein